MLTVKRLAQALVVIALVAGSGGVTGCGDDKVVSTSPGDDDDDPNDPNRGYLEGRARLAGNNENTNQIVIRIINAVSDEEVDTTFADDEGDFRSKGLQNGTYHVEASAPIAGYSIGRRENIAVVIGQTREIPGVIDIPDTSRVRMFDLQPVPGQEIIPRRPVISGRFTSDGSGILARTFSLVVNDVRVSDDADLEVGDDLRTATFSYEPRRNLQPGDIAIRLRIQNRAGNSTSAEWTFNVLDGVRRHVPDDYQTIDNAIFHSNEGDTVLVARGVHETDNVRVTKQVTILAEAMLDGGTPGDTILLAPNSRHFRFTDAVTSDTMLRGFLLRGGDVIGAEANAGSIECRSCSAQIEDCVFDGNRVDDGRGGAISMLNQSAMGIRRCVFKHNLARRGGAVAMFDHSTPTIEECVFIDNKAVAMGSEGGLGGALFLLASQPSITRCTFVDNRAGVNGGALMADGTPSVGESLVSSVSNLFVDNGMESSPNQSGVHMHNSSRFSSGCDGYLRTALSGSSGNYQVSGDMQLPFDASAGFCAPERDDYHLMPSSPVWDAANDEGCDVPGAFETGCGGGGLFGLWR